MSSTRRVWSVEWLLSQGALSRSQIKEWTQATVTLHRTRGKLVLETSNRSHIQVIPISRRLKVSYNDPLARNFIICLKTRYQEVTLAVFNESDGYTLIDGLSKSGASVSVAHQELSAETKDKDMDSFIDLDGTDSTDGIEWKTGKDTKTRSVWYCDDDTDDKDEEDEESENGDVLEGLNTDTIEHSSDSSDSAESLDGASASTLPVAAKYSKDTSILSQSSKQSGCSSTLPRAAKSYSNTSTLSRARKHYSNTQVENKEPNFSSYEDDVHNDSKIGLHQVKLRKRTSSPHPKVRNRTSFPNPIKHSYSMSTLPKATKVAKTLKYSVSTTRLSKAGKYSLGPSAFPTAPKHNPNTSTSLGASKKPNKQNTASPALEKFLFLLSDEDSEEEFEPEKFGLYTDPGVIKFEFDDYPDTVLEDHKEVFDDEEDGFVLGAEWIRTSYEDLDLDIAKTVKFEEGIIMSPHSTSMHSKTVSKSAGNISSLKDSTIAEEIAWDRENIQDQVDGESTDTESSSPASDSHCSDTDNSVEDSYC